MRLVRAFRWHFALAARAMVVLIGIAAGAPRVLAQDAPRENAAVRWAEDGPGGTPSFTKHVVPLFNRVGCSNRTCHGSFQGQNGFRLSLFGYDPALDHRELTADEGGGPRVNVKDADASLALLKPLGDVFHKGGTRLKKSSWQHRLLREWIAAGAPFEPKQEAALKRLDVHPAELPLRVGNKIRLRIEASFADGSREDVTALTTFATNDDGVAQVDEHGMVAAVGHGATAIVVTYGDGVVTAPVVASFTVAAPFPAFPANNKIDELVAVKLRKLNLFPSDLCTDEAFLRRAYVDVIGTLPTADETRAFLNDPAPGKRQRVIDQLLARPEYAAYWASIFSDWIGNNQSNINPSFKTIWLVHDWLRDKLDKNWPYDRFVGGMLTAASRDGRSLDEYLAENKAVHEKMQPRAGFDDGVFARRQTLDLYWMRRVSDRPKELAIRSANTFLGLQIQCAECHKHPFDRWTQNDFEGFTSFFRVVDICNLDGSDKTAGAYDYDKVALYARPAKRTMGLVKKHPPRILGGAVVPYAEEGVDPRNTLWEWMRAPDNPYFARNIVNRLWHHYFGVGIVDPVDDLNRANPPSNPELLEWLARDFIEHGFNLKRLHRTILRSRTYQLSHLPSVNNRADRRNFAHALVRRMPAEVALDAIVQATGTKLVFNNYAAPPGTRAIGLAASVRFGKSEYFLRTFGRPERQQTCACERSNEPSLAQALYLINDADIHGRIADPKGRLADLQGKISDDRQLIDELYLSCLTRHPQPEETRQIMTYLQKASSRQDAMQDVLWSLLNVREFVFVR